MSISQQAGVLAIGAIFSVVVAVVSYVSGRISAKKHPRMVSNTERVIDRFADYGIPRPTVDLPKMHRTGVLGAILASGLTLCTYVAAISFADALRTDGLTASWVVYAVDTIMALAIAFGWGLGIPFIFAALGLIETEDGGVYARIGRSICYVSLALFIACVIFRYLAFPH